MSGKAALLSVLVEMPVLTMQLQGDPRISELRRSVPAGTWLRHDTVPLCHIFLSFLPSHMDTLRCFQQSHTIARKCALLNPFLCSYKSWLGFCLQFILIICVNTQRLVKVLRHRKSNKVSSLWMPWFGYKDNTDDSHVEGLGHHITVILRGGWVVTILASTITSCTYMLMGKWAVRRRALAWGKALNVYLALSPLLSVT